ncbi:MAG: universal stress protein family protein [Bacteroidetes bacterium HLUCCA01]|nr:MAG: universal stress protein family protein [Bacteroidetes bacterium HLUCCA01]
MEKMKILVPTDFSELSFKAFEAAGHFARVFDGKIVPFHAYIPLSEMDSFYYSGVGLSGNVDYTQVEKTVETRLLEVASDHVDERLLDKPLLGVGNPAHAVSEAAEDCGLIVLTTHGRTGFSRFLMGSVAEKVLRLTHTPVLVVEEKSVIKPIERILVTTDFSDNSTKAFPFAAQIASKTGAEIHLINILMREGFDTDTVIAADVKLREKELGEMKDNWFSDVKDKVQTRVIVSFKSVHEAIVHENSASPYDLVVISTIGRTGLDYLMLGSTAASVVRHVTSPVLSINPRRIEK